MREAPTATRPSARLLRPARARLAIRVSASETKAPCCRRGRRSCSWLSRLLRWQRSPHPRRLATLTRSSSITPTRRWRGECYSETDFKIVRTGFTAMSDGSTTCQGFHPRKGDLLVTGAAEASDASSTVSYVRVKVFRTAQMAHTDWQRTAVAPAAQRCRLTQLQSFRRSHADGKKGRDREGRALPDRVPWHWTNEGPPDRCVTRPIGGMSSSSREERRSSSAPNGLTRKAMTAISSPTSVGAS